MHLPFVLKEKQTQQHLWSDKGKIMWKGHLCLINYCLIIFGLHSLGSSYSIILVVYLEFFFSFHTLVLPVYLQCKAFVVYD